MHSFNLMNCILGPAATRWAALFLGRKLPAHLFSEAE